MTQRERYWVNKICERRDREVELSRARARWRWFRNSLTPESVRLLQALKRLREGSV